VEQVRALHRKGRYGLDICPQNIVMSRSGAVLRVKSLKLNADGAMTPHPGVSAPEWYTGGAVGPWTDVYAVSALVYRAVTGRMLAPAFERSADDAPLFDGLIEKFQPLADAISQGLALDISLRATALDALSVQIQACLIGFNSAPMVTKQAAKTKTNPIPDAHAAANKATMPEGLNGRRRIAVIGVVIGALLLGGTWLVNEVNYSQTVSLIEAGAYTEAQRSLKGVFAFYGDTGDLSRYAEAGLKLEYGEYEAAARLFSELGNYRNAADMVSETAYRHAQYLMQKGNYAEADTLLKTIGGYKDAAQMRTEIAYQNACACMDAGLYLSALDALQLIDPYNDTTELIDKAKGMLYEAALSALTAGDTDTAALYFAAIPGYEQTDDYVRRLTLLAHIQSGGMFTKDDYNAFMGLANFMDITPYLTSDSLIAHYLCGNWQDEEGSKFVMDKAGGIQYNLPGIDGGAYTFKDGVMSMAQSDGSEVPMFGFTCVDLDTVAIYCYEDRMTYTLTRQYNDR
jgi:outer membrane protein assembly factor BamD (BamD/ComL family)